MNMLNASDLSHPTRVIGFGHVAAKIIRSLDEIPADRIVFHQEFEDGDYGPSVVAADNLIDIKLNLGWVLPGPIERLAEKIVRMIIEHNLLSLVIEGASHVVFFAPLPSAGGYVLHNMLLHQIDFSSPSYKNIYFDAVLQLPFPFEGRTRTKKAEKVQDAISRCVNTKVYELEKEVNGHAGYHGMGINIKELFEYADRLMAVRIKECLPIEQSVPLLAVDRHRIGVDGDGVTTLVCFQGCPLHCKYCMNDDCHDSSDDFPHYTPLQLYEEVKVDNLYFLATGGGVCFGGGEPLLRMQFVSDFKAMCDNGWKLTAETSLCVPRNMVYKAAKVFDDFIVDIKESDSKIYKEYTGGDCELAWDNLSLLLRLVGSDRIMVRVPMIPGYNDRKAVERTAKKLIGMGILKIDRFTCMVEKRIAQTDFFPDMDTVKLDDYREERKERPTMGIPYRPGDFWKSVFGGDGIDD